MPPDPETALVTRYAPAEARPAVGALLALDAALAAVLRSTREPIVGQMRLTWWDERLRALDHGETVAQPELQALAAATARGVRGEVLAAMIDGWEIVLSADALDEDALARYARARGKTLFAAIAGVCGAAEGDPVAAGGEGWALADLARNTSDEALAALARKLARPRLDAARKWSRNGRSLGALVHLARGEDRTPPARLARLVYHRFTGR